MLNSQEICSVAVYLRLSKDDVERLATEIVYGDILEEDKSKKVSMRFEICTKEDGDGYKTTLYRLVPNENHPSAWNEIYQNPPEIEDKYTVHDFLMYAALKATFPECKLNMNNE